MRKAEPGLHETKLRVIVNIYKCSYLCLWVASMEERLTAVVIHMQHQQLLIMEVCYVSQGCSKNDHHVTVS